MENIKICTPGKCVNKGYKNTPCENVFEANLLSPEIATKLTGLYTKFLIENNLQRLCKDDLVFIKGIENRLFSEFTKIIFGCNNLSMLIQMYRTAKKHNMVSCIKMSIQDKVSFVIYGNKKIFELIRNDCKDVDTILHTDIFEHLSSLLEELYLKKEA